MQLAIAPEAEAPWMTSERWISSTSPTSATLAGSQLALLALLPCLPSRAPYTWECRDDSTADQYQHVFFSLLPFLFKYRIGLIGFPNESGTKRLPHVLSPVRSHFSWPRRNAVATRNICKVWTAEVRANPQGLHHDHVQSEEIHGVEQETRSMFLETAALCHLICPTIPGIFGLKLHLCKRNVWRLLDTAKRIGLRCAYVSRSSFMWPETEAYKRTSPTCFKASKQHPLVLVPSSNPLCQLCQIIQQAAPLEGNNFIYSLPDLAHDF